MFLMEYFLIVEINGDAFWEDHLIKDLTGFYEKSCTTDNMSMLSPH